RCVCGKKIGPDPRNFNQRVSLGRNDLLIRTFPKGSGIYTNIYGAASSTFELLNAAPAEVYSWSFESERGNTINVISENSALPVNHGLNFSVHIKASE
ncbi:hypothetical protein ACNQ08_24720, partial [Enterobacter cloacae complex sp.6730661]